MSFERIYIFQKRKSIWNKNHSPAVNTADNRLFIVTMLQFSKTPSSNVQKILGLLLVLNNVIKVQKCWDQFWFSIELHDTFQLDFTILSEQTNAKPNSVLFLYSTAVFNFLSDISALSVDKSLCESNTKGLHCALWSVWRLSLIHIWRCRRSTLCRSRWSPYH